MKNLFKNGMRLGLFYDKETQNTFREKLNDEIKKKKKKIVDEFKLNLEPLYKDRLTKWKKLKK